MIVLDANVLLYAYDSSSSAHARCKDWLEAALNGEAQIAIPWQTLLAFVRIATNPGHSAVRCRSVRRWSSWRRGRRDPTS